MLRTYLSDCVEINPDWGAAWANLASIRRLIGQGDAAVALNLRALEHHRNPSELMLNFINSMTSAGRADEAFDLQTRLAISANQPTALESNLNARILFEQGRPRAALPQFEAALAADTDNQKLRQAAAMALFQMGAYRQAFDAFEARWLTGEFLAYPSRATRWDGGPLSGKKAIIIGEQGLGDIIFLCRFLPKLKALGAQKLTFAVRAPLVRLVEQLGLCDQVIPFPGDAQPDDMIGDHDVWLPAFDMMRHLAANAAECPPPLPFPILSDSKARAERLVSRYANRFKIGIVWKSEVRGERHTEKSAALQDFLSLCEFRGIQLFSLHKGPGTEEIASLGAKGLIVDAGSSDADLADTAAMIKQLNLIITIDTAVAHLAGSLGAPTWMLAPEPPHWYWWHPGDVSQFYPSMRIYRQSQRMRWDDVFARLRNDLGRVFN